MRNSARGREVWLSLATSALNTRRTNTTRVKAGLQMPFATDREHTHALQHVTAKVQSCQRVFCRQSRCKDGLEAPRLEIFDWGAPQRRARHVQRAVPTEHAQSLPRRLGHGRFDLGQNLTRSPPLQRTGLVWRTNDAAAWPQCTHLVWSSAVHEPLAQLSNVLHCPLNVTTHGAKIANTCEQKKIIHHHPSS